MPYITSHQNHTFLEMCKRNGKYKSKAEQYMKTCPPIIRQYYDTVIKCFITTTVLYMVRHILLLRGHDAAQLTCLICGIAVQIMNKHFVTKYTRVCSLT